MLAAISAAVVGSVLPILVRKSRHCHWTTVEFITTSFASFLLTPVCLGAWFAADHALYRRTINSLAGGWGGPDAWSYRPYGLHVLLFAATLGFVGLALQTYGYQNERSTRASLMSFIEVPFAYALQVFREHACSAELAVLSLQC